MQVLTYYMEIIPLKTKYIYVLDENGKPLMPTKRLGMVRHWLKNGEAHWCKNSRNTIQFDRKTTNYTQKTVEGCDLGDHLGVSVIANGQELYSSESYCNGNQTHKLMQSRKEYRRTRRGRLRHRKARFDNRKKHTIYPPSIQRKLQFQIKEIEKISKFLPISKVICESSIFDITKLTGHAQQQKGYVDLLDFLYARDDGRDALDGKKYPKKYLVIHHLVHRADGGTNNPDNLVLLTQVHHNMANHNNGVLDQITRNRQKMYRNVDTRGAYFMNVLNMELTKHIDCLFTAGYTTASLRKKYGIPKTHHDDAFVIAGGTNKTERLGYTIYREKLRDNDRSLEKFYDAHYRNKLTGKSESGKKLSSGRTSRSRELPYINNRPLRANKLGKGRRSIRQQHYQIRPNDLIEYNGKLYISHGNHNKGASVKLNLDSTDSKKFNYVSVKKLKCVHHVNGISLRNAVW